MLMGCEKKQNEEYQKQATTSIFASYDDKLLRKHKQLFKITIDFNSQLASTRRPSGRFGDGLTPLWWSHGVTATTSMNLDYTLEILTSHSHNVH